MGSRLRPMYNARMYELCVLNTILHLVGIESDAMSTNDYMHDAWRFIAHV